MRLLKGLNWKRINRAGGLVGLALAVVLHLVLKEALAGSAAAASLLAPGGNVPLGALALVGGLVLARLVVVLLIPALLLAELGMWAAGRLMARGAEAEEKETATPEGPRA